MIKFYENIDSYVERYSDLIGVQFEDKSDLLSEIGMIISEIVSKYSDRPESYIRRLISSTIYNKLNRYYDKSDKRSMEEKISYNELSESLKYIHNNIENYIVVKDLLNVIQDKKLLVSQKYYDIFTMYFINGYSMAEIAEEYGVTRERIRQIILKSLRRLRHPAYIKYVSTNEEVCTPAKRINKKDLVTDNVNSELSMIRDIAKLLVDCYLKDSSLIPVKEIKINNINTNFRLLLADEITDRLDYIREIYSKSTISKKEFLKILDPELDVENMLRIELKITFNEYMELLRLQLMNDLDELISQKRIKL